MRRLIVSEFITLDGVIQAPGGENEDLDGGFQHGGWVPAYWDDAIGASFFELVSHVDALLLGRCTYEGHATAFENAPSDDPFAAAMNAPKKYVVSTTLKSPSWRNTTIIASDIVGAVRALKAEPGRDILTDGSSQLVQALLAHDLVDELHLVTFPLFVGGGKRLFPTGSHAKFKLESLKSVPSGVALSHYLRA